jgi:PAS domain S-box-containing protein
MDLVASIADPAYTTDGNGKIVEWNPACERLLGLRVSDVIGCRCYDVVAGRDLSGKRFCADTCPVRSLIYEKEPVGHFVLDVQTGRGVPLRVRVAIVAVPGGTPERDRIVHLLTPERSTRALEPREHPVSTV